MSGWCRWLGAGLPVFLIVLISFCAHGLIMQFLCSFSMEVNT